MKFPNKDISNSSPIIGWRLNPRVAKILIVVAITTGLLGLFSGELGLNSFFKHITFSASLLCMSAFVLPEVKIWQKTTEE